MEEKGVKKMENNEELRQLTVEINARIERLERQLRELQIELLKITQQLRRSIEDVRKSLVSHTDAER